MSKKTGSAFGVQTLLPKEMCLIEGRFEIYKEVADSGSEVSFKFCPQCGSTVLWEIPFYKDQYGVAVGCINERDLPDPTFSCYEDRMLGWMKTPDSIEERMD